MGFQSLIRTQVEKAFKQLGDLKDIAIFTAEKPTVFDFNNQQMSSVIETKAVEGVLLKRTKYQNKEGDSAFDATFLINTSNEALGDISMFSTAVIKGVTWKIVHPYSTNGFTTTVKLKAA